MQSRTRQRVFQVLWAACCLLAVLGGGLAVYLVHMGAYAPGDKSLGHVGIVVAGLASGFGAVVFALLGLYSWLRAREAKAPDPAAPR